MRRRPSRLARLAALLPAVRLLVPVLAATLVLVPARPAAAQEEPQPEPPPPPTASSVGALVQAELNSDGRSVALPVVRTPRGPLVAAAVVAQTLGGELAPVAGTGGYALEVPDARAIFALGSATLTIGSEIHQLSQPPISGPGGALVPLDLLERVYGDHLGYAFAWSVDPLRLSVDRNAARQLALTVEAIELDGLTTVVLSFDERPSYEIVREPDRVHIELRGNRVVPPPLPQLTAASLAAGIDVFPERIVLRLRPGVDMDHYELEEPFRLVVDLMRGSSAPVIGAPEPTIAPPRPRGGVHTIVLDPGHGGDETGASGPGGSLEKVLTLELARELERALESRLQVRVLLTRTEDRVVDLDARSAFANANKADLFVSIHLNSTRGGSAHGAETYFLSLTASDEQAARAAAVENIAGAPADEDDPLYDLNLILWDMAQSRHLAQSQQFAKLIQEELNRSLGLADRGVKQAPFRVLKGAGMPAVLVELGFINNPSDEQRLNDPAYREQLIDALVRAIERYRAALAPAPAAEPAAAETPAAEPAP